MIEQTTLYEPPPRNAMLIALEIIEMIPKDKIDKENHERTFKKLFET
jgi:hypothetical protein